MAVISAGRYFFICRGIENKIKIMPCIVILWLISILLSVLFMGHWEMPEYFTENRLIGCRYITLFSVPFFTQKYQTILVSIIVYIVPTIVVAVLYSKVIQKINSVKVKGREAKIEHRNWKTTKMLISILVWYDALCAPLFLVSNLDVFLKILPIELFL
ncbi:hypothetical protein B4U80_14428 [Leptotrombidium deliense]|uniref:G-protein coupled receptors family 1 profile domain-containing protein n=1 Tax=Leptotrombidium deliense TaxID=299467 RepID=A0A443RVQ5_9ACAR|nr:hypothetical protein B4U80_14428 [Leptotrombidium deliense]